MKMLTTFNRMRMTVMTVSRMSRFFSVRLLSSVEDRWMNFLIRKYKAADTIVIAGRMNASYFEP